MEIGCEKGTAGDHKGPPSHSPPPSPLRTGKHVSQNLPMRAQPHEANTVGLCWVGGIQADGDGSSDDAVEQVVVGVQPVLSGCCSRSGGIVGDAPGDVEDVGMLRGVDCEGNRVNRCFGC